MSEHILEMQGIVKEFPGVKALDNVTFSVRPGEVHALVGENGAGKSTLMKVLSGVYPFGTYQGKILINGQEQPFHSIRDSEQAGVAIIYQELALVKQLSIMENICLGHETARHGVISWDEAHLKAKKALDMVGLSINPSMPIQHLGVGEQQLVEIAKALAKNARILILDEPTAALAEGEAANLLKILKNLREKGVTCIYISHRLREVFELADRITILRDGRTVATRNKADLNEDKLISLMVGRDLTNVYPWKKREAGKSILEVKSWSVYDAAINKTIADVSFTVRQNEILGVAGLVGAGRTELVMSLFNIWGRVTGGEIFLEGRKLSLNSASDAIQAGISLASEDRKRYGLVLTQDIRRNTSLASLPRISKYSVVNGNEEIVAAEKYTHDLRIKTPSIEQKTMNLSGGNQQKVVLGKWLMTMPKVLILDEPTRGIDVGAKVEIYNIVNELVDQGVGVIMISSELPEILGMSDRILVMHEGRFTGELMRAEATQEKIMHYATGGK
ncbi:MAG TPA: xylose ABC transporter ATP-binding protein [Verrucomicrobia bacterium]|nr:MAG: D-xylose ABC transporter ATP-binding protein [Lentisphaerae bacterium GWF2_57_35]HBA83023.1 xylose ABC transporter ATP-binding protein [Verrucomicrobiota bacterium]